MEVYRHLVQYYETDKMGVTHHSNYIRWMEEARVHFLKAIGWDYVKLENMGAISPVINIECQYKLSTYFADEVDIEVSIFEYTGVKLVFSYVMKNQGGKVVCTAKSSHCFLDENGRPLRLAKSFPELNDALSRLAAEDAAK